VAGRRLGDAAPADSLFHAALDGRFVQVVPPALTGLAIHVHAGCGKDPLPSPLPPGIGILALKPTWKRYPAGAVAEIPLVLLSHRLKVSG
jgi:hypothetical protein